MDFKRILPPDPEQITDLTPEDLGLLVLPVLKRTHDQRMNLMDFSLGVRSLQLSNEAQAALHEGLQWLVRAGLLTPFHDGSIERFFVSRRGEDIENETQFRAFTAAEVLPRKLLHPVIDRAAWGSFLRGDYDTAVIAAFKRVEVAVRKAGDYPDSKFGAQLMQDAFQVNKGPLADWTLPTSEQVGLRDLFSGAFQQFRNPTGHRDVEFEPEEVSRLLLLASELLYIVERRRERLAERGTTDQGEEVE